MSRFHQNFFLLLITLFVLSVCITAQTKARPRTSNSITGVYAGFSLPLIGVNGDMQTYMRTFYFRENGTYVTELDELDWQTRIDGNYKIIGNKLIVQSNIAGDSPSEIEIKENGGFLFYAGASLLKLNAVSSIPSVIVNHNSGASSGGIGTNNIFVAVSSFDLYNFDGRGNFSHNSSSASVISGASVGGGKSKNNSGGGTYTIKDGLLALNYSDGKVVKKSFFYSESDGDGTALINGSFHFETDESKKKSGLSATVLPQTPESLKEENEINKSGLKILKEANTAHGGVKLDDLKTIRMTGKLNAVESADFNILTDLKQQRVRHEYRKNNVLLGIEQSDANGGWQWDVRSGKTPMSNERYVQMQQTFTSGIFGLRAKLTSNILFEKVEINKNNNSKSLIVYIERKKYGLIFDSDNRLVVETKNEGGIQQTFSTDFRNVNGIVVPFEFKVTQGKNLTEVKLSLVEVNPNLTEKDWSSPREN